MTNLDRLNELLTDPKLKLPTFRQSVSPSLNNLKWLQTKFMKSPNCSLQLKVLLSMDRTLLLSGMDSPQSMLFASRKENELMASRVEAVTSGLCAPAA